MNQAIMKFMQANSYTNKKIRRYVKKTDIMNALTDTTDLIFT